ncbi:MAG: hypothetical protein C0596_11850 [Marinilabiliales bacterium]|nr:MAG: hypothetical protein C0596_11850 [Marinilabiliales bacterium]
MITGAMQGLFSALIAIAVLFVIVYFMNNQIGEMLNLIDWQNLGILFIVVIVLGVFLSVISTFFSINKYLRLKSTNLYY